MVALDNQQQRQRPNGLAVFMGNVPSDLTAPAFKTQLSPFLEQLRIEDWTCDKPRGKAFGILTFLHRKDGQIFLNKHGEQPVPGAPLTSSKHGRMRAHLSLLGKPVYCRESDNGPDPMLLKVIEMNAEERNRPAEEAEETQEHKRVVFETWGVSCGHYDYPNETLTYTADVQWPGRGGVAKFARNMLIVSFPHSLGQIRLEMPYRAIQEVAISNRPTSLFLTLWEPPKIFLLPHASDEHGLVNQFRNLSANSNLPRPSQRERLNKIPHDSTNHGEVIGQSLIYCVTLSPAEFATKIERLRENEYLEFSLHNVPVASVSNSYMTEGLASFKSAVSKLSQTIPFDILYQFQALVQNGYLLPRTVENLLIRLEKSKYYEAPKKVEDEGESESRPLLARFPLSAPAVKKLFSQIPFPGPNTEAISFHPVTIWSMLEANETEIQHGLIKELISQRASQNLTMVHKVQVTPTRILFNGPEPEAKNRIIRKFPRHTGYFARIQFCDEDGQDLFYNPKVSLQQIYSRFKKILLDGFPIAGRLYKFLGFSHSSLRSHAVWFMASFVDDNKQLRSYATVIPELGDFKGIRSPARWYVPNTVDLPCAARIGQAFSETPIAIDLDELDTHIQLIPDVKSADGTRVFSDGVGTISRDLLEEIHARMPQKSSTATCLQIRWAGAKGMLSLDDTLEGITMCVRDSMTKFKSLDTQNLEICDVANKPIPLVLNRQMIKILEDMGVPNAWFFKGQNRELARLRKITALTQNTVTFLKRQKIAEQMGFAQFIRRLHNLGFDYKKDEFLCSVVEAVVLREVRLLKHKSRIPVEQGVTLFGVMDEFGYLGDEEVFVTFDKQGGTSYPDLHDRLVIVTRSPALHPGDIQIRRAIEPPRDHPLRSLSNCIVFSQNGSRDLPSQLSGGDLDGDIYNIIWDSMAVDGCRLEFKPADYPRVSPLDIGRDVQAEDMTNFFVDFMATDQLGLIANKHIILADVHDAGTVHDECKLLAEMHSTAVDYSKTGIPVDISKMASASLRSNTRYRPDFLAPAPPTHFVDKTEIRFEPPTAPSAEADEDDDTGPRHKFYKSEKILGQLYRAIDEKRIWKDDIHLAINRSGVYLWDELFIHIKSQCDEHFGVVDWERALDEAHSIRKAYEDAIWTATIDYSDHSSQAITELEVFTGTIFNKSGIQTRRQRDTSIRLKDEFDRTVKWVEALIRKREANSSSDVPDSIADDQPNGNYEESLNAGTDITALEMSIACFHAGLMRRGRGGPKKRNVDEFESFKVIAAHCALRELEMAIKQKEIAEGAAFTSGGYPGVRSGRA
ncbi:RNA dependent RNA polymerase-domain-containing protein [Nemania sp. NC0429]|nr:RNA dependent RNA polymerase-domain-containing protein [Nemania sp. NC0429]